MGVTGTSPLMSNSLKRLVDAVFRAGYNCVGGESSLIHGNLPPEIVRELKKDADD